MSTDLHEIAKRIVAPHQGILAADESSPTIRKRFDHIGVTSRSGKPENVGAAQKAHLHRACCMETETP